MRRLPNWQSRLEEFLEAHRADVFRYGRWDCCLFVCDAILAMTGVDVAEAFRGRYTSRETAFNAVAAYAGRRSLRDLVVKITAEFGMPEVPPEHAQRGDVVLVRRASGFSLGIVSLDGSGILIVRASGLELAPRSLALRCFHV